MLNLLFYDDADGFYFASEPQVLRNPKEVHPRLLYVYNGSLQTQPRNFFHTDVIDDNVELIRSKVTTLFENAVRKRKSTKVAILFSGGVDSTAIAYVLDQLNIPFVCITVHCGSGADLEMSRKVCEHYGWELEEVCLSETDVER